MKLELQIENIILKMGNEMGRLGKYVLVIAASLSFWVQPGQAAQSFELKQHFYYTIQKNGKLLGYAEEYLKPVKELPNLEVEISMKTVIGKHLSPSKKIQLEKKEVYYIDLTHDKMLRGMIEYNDRKHRRNFQSRIDFNRYKIITKTGSSQSREILMSRNTLLGYHRFLSLFIEERIAENIHQGSLPLIWTETGEISIANWRAMSDTTLFVNGFRLMCHHFMVYDKNFWPIQEVWCLRNSGRLVRNINFKSKIMTELADVRYKNYLETPLQLSTKKPLLQQIDALVSHGAAPTTDKFSSRLFDQPLNDTEYPLDAELFPVMEKYLEPIYANNDFDADTLFQIGVEFSKGKYYLDEMLTTFSRWSTQKRKLKPTLNKNLNQWSDTDFQRFTQSLALFSRICRVANIPTRFVQGVYCISVVDNLFYNWVWVEISDGKKWYPWHLEFPFAPYGGAEFIRLRSADWEDIESFRFVLLKGWKVEFYEFQQDRSLFF